MKPENIKLIYVDLFCGAGGTSTGVHRAQINGERCAIVAACINHDENAIRSHKSNHKQTLHFTEDITLLYTSKRWSHLIAHVAKVRAMYPDAQLVLWASLECTNFSKAKGGMPRDGDSRTLANHLFPYFEALKPDRVQIENVEEFMSWGPLDDNGKPLSKTAGSDYIRWIERVKTYGYHFEHRILNAADYGALTSRKRYFGQFARHGESIFWPEQTHAENPVSDLFGKPLKKWRAVREVLDFSDEGESIFDRKKPLVDATNERVYAGLIKFVAGGKKEFLLKYNSMSRDKKYIAPSVDAPCPVVSTQGRLGVCNVQFMSKAYSGDPQHKVQSVEKPAGTVTTKDHHQLVSTSFIQQRHNGNPSARVSSIERPSRTITTTDGNLDLVNATFLTAYYSTGDNVSSIDRPAPTVTTKDRFCLVQSRFFMNQYSCGGTGSSVERPSPTILPNPKQNLITCRPWVMNTNFKNVGASINEPAQTITANRKWHYLLNPQFTSAGGSVDRPCFTLIARMDKMPPYLVDACNDTGHLPSFVKHCQEGLIYEIYESDSEIVRKIKEFMAMYGIADIRMRMLRIKELKKIMGFPEDYVLIGTQGDQKKYIGNAVEVRNATAMVEATAIGIGATRQKMYA